MEIIVRATVIFAFLWVLTRGLGKRELAQLTGFELLVLVTMGDLIQQGVTQEDTSVTGAMLAVGTFAGLSLLIGYLSFRFRSLRTVVEGMPVLVMRDGRLLDEVLHLERLHLEELKASAREQGIEDLARVRFCVLEADGGFSFVKYDGEQHQQPEHASG